MHARNFFRQLPWVLLTLVGGLAIAQSATTGRVFPYVGYLEENGFPVDGDRYLRLSLFAVETGGSACLVRDFDTVTVNAGRFQVEVVDVPDACLVTGDLFAAVAVGQDAGSLVNLTSGVGAGRTRIGSVPFAAASPRAAPLLIADDADIAGSLNVNGTTDTGTLNADTASVADTLEVGSSATVGGAVSARSLTTSQGAAVGSTLSVGSTLTVGGALSVNGANRLGPAGSSFSNLRAGTYGTCGGAGLPTPGSFDVGMTLGSNSVVLVTPGEYDNNGCTTVRVIGVSGSTVSYNSWHDAAQASCGCLHWIVINP